MKKSEIRQKSENLHPCRYAGECWGQEPRPLLGDPLRDTKKNARVCANARHFRT